MQRLPSDSAKRLQLEQAIVEKAKEIEWDAEEQCFPTPALKNFVLSWHDLASYFCDHSDTSIGVDVVREYLYWFDKLADIVLSPDSQPECRAEMEEALSGIKFMMQEIIKEVDRQLYPEGR